MSLIEKIKFLRFECYQDLNDWEKEFISDLEEGIDGLGNASDAEVEDYLTRRQIEKVIQIWEEQGL